MSHAKIFFQRNAKDQHTGLNYFFGSIASVLTISGISDEKRVTGAVRLIREFNEVYPSTTATRCLEEYDESIKGE